MPGHFAADDRGFSLVETLFATAILTTAVSGLAQLFILSARANAGAGTTTSAVLIAQQKMEQLRGLTWGFDSIGVPASDPMLARSPADALAVNAGGFCDFLDRFGRPVPGDAAVPSRASYVRRWSIEPLPSNPGDTLVLQVRVVRIGTPSAVSAPPPAARLGDEARLVSVRTRKAS